MRRLLTAALLLALGALALSGAATGAPPPKAPPEFFGIGPQSPLTPKDAEYMKAGGIGVVRMAIPWSSVQSSKRGGYNWTGLDEGVGIAARAGLRVLPFFWGTPHWLARKPTTMPIDSGRQRAEWTAFLTAAVERYGPRGEFWKEHAAATGGVPYEPAGVNYEPAGVNYPPPIRRQTPIPKLPIRSWQIWNEANFFYFALPASPSRYAKLVKISSQAIKAADPGAKVILSGLFAKPTANAPRGMPAVQFLKALYRVPGLKTRFDGISLHPYAVDTETLEEYVEEFHDVTTENHDRVPLYITEMGWGSQNDFQQVAFEQGVQGQVRQLRGAYTYLLENRNRLDVKQVYWFSWKDIQGDCNFCDSVGLFKEGERFRPKPSWHAFTALSGGRARP
jgi:polysaccharide biosynthesis protein PslG